MYSSFRRWWATRGKRCRRPGRKTNSGRSPFARVQFFKNLWIWCEGEGTSQRVGVGAAETKYQEQIVSRVMELLFFQCMATINAKIKTPVKMETPESKGGSTEVVKGLRTLSMKDVGVRMAPLQDRFGLSSSLSKIRMYNVSLKICSTPITAKKLFAGRTEQKKRTSQIAIWRENLWNPKEVIYCLICFATDPALPDDIEPDEEESQVTQWLRCQDASCGTWVHAECGRLNVEVNVWSCM